MQKNGTTQETKIQAIMQWFKKSVAYEGKPYIMDLEQVAAVISDDKDAIVVARAGSGKTRTIVAKIVYLIAMCGIKEDEIMVFVFNANAAREINERLTKMTVDGVSVVNKKAIIASTFHAFSRKVVFDICGGREKRGKILVGERERFVREVVLDMIKNPKWLYKTKCFIKGEEIKNDGSMQGELEEHEVARFIKMMMQFINRAQQQYLVGKKTLQEDVRRRLMNKNLGIRELVFVELGAECYRRYHLFLLNGKMIGFEQYSTDFNLVVSWASKLILERGTAVQKLLNNKKYVLIDEYQDFSQLFLSIIMAIREIVPEIRLFVVGDDWQAINRFAGSDVEYFKGFEHFFVSAKRYEIATNYRCNREIVERARKFMKRAMNEKGNFRAFSRRLGKVVLVNPRFTACEYAFVDYDRRVGGRDRLYAEMTKRMIRRMPKKSTIRYVKTLVQIIRKNRKCNDILILHRNNEMGLEGIRLTSLMDGLKWGLLQLKVFTDIEFDKKVRGMTMHKSKGLEAEVVIILEADEGVIPKMHPDTMLYSIFGETLEVALEDQVRLFYVAMTRAKKRLYIVHDDVKGEGFIKYLGRGVEIWE